MDQLIRKVIWNFFDRVVAHEEHSCAVRVEGPQCGAFQAAYTMTLIVIKVASPSRMHQVHETLAGEAHPERAKIDGAKDRYVLAVSLYPSDLPGPARFPNPRERDRPCLQLWAGGSC